MHLLKEGEDSGQKQWEANDVRRSSEVKENGGTSLGNWVITDLEFSG